ncbi:MAG: prolipoprotein diacylglyceryl transferase [Candidatus Gracilibacteria bacterium]|nr:prolipoprotein diacylglyceryl transferase [Candidatus Gracilibacteria bacterium]
MYPFFEIFPGFYIYTFGLTLTICFFVFLWMLKKLSGKFGINNTFFFNRILWYFLSVFFFSRLFYVISRWSDFKFIKDPLEFFLMSDYNFSLIGAIFGYFLVLFISIILHNIKSGKYMDVSVLAFLFSCIIGFFGSFLGGQVYGKETNFGIEILYTNSFSPVPYEVPVFPLPIVYSIIFFILFSVLYMFAMFISVRGIIGYLGLALIGSILLILDNFSGKYDYFKIELGISFTQIGAIFLIISGFYGLYRIYKTPKNSEII